MISRLFRGDRYTDSKCLQSGFFRVFSRIYSLFISVPTMAARRVLNPNWHSATLEAASGLTEEVPWPMPAPARAPAPVVPPPLPPVQGMNVLLFLFCFFFPISLYIIVFL